MQFFEIGVFFAFWHEARLASHVDKINAAPSESIDTFILGMGYESPPVLHSTLYSPHKLYLIHFSPGETKLGQPIPFCRLNYVLSQHFVRFWLFKFSWSWSSIWGTVRKRSCASPGVSSFRCLVILTLPEWQSDVVSTFSINSKNLS